MWVFRACMSAAFTVLLLYFSGDSAPRYYGFPSSNLPRFLLCMLSSI